MYPARTSFMATLGRGALWACLGLAMVGCSTVRLNQAREDLYSGQPEKAEAALTEAEIPKKNAVLFLMERGTIRQALGEYEASSDDFIAAFDRLRELETYSLSQGAGSLVINDSVQDYVGAPFERTLLHALTAQNHFALGHWDNAAIEARRIIDSLSDEYRRNYPEEPYSRYIAGLALQLIGDPSNAAMQFRVASDALSQTAIDPDTGRLAVASTNAPSPIRPEQWDAELVVLIQLGRSPRGSELGSISGYERAWLFAEIQVDGKKLGQSYSLTDTAYLKYETDRVRALRDAAKIAARIVVKESIASAVQHNSNGAAGDLTRLVLIGLLERPDFRRWETLPRWFQVARVPCPPDLTSFDLVLKNQQGQTVSTHTIDAPIQRRGNTFISMYRELPVRSP